MRRPRGVGHFEAGVGHGGSLTEDHWIEKGAGRSAAPQHPCEQHHEGRTAAQAGRQTGTCRYWPPCQIPRRNMPRARRAPPSAPAARSVRASARRRLAAALDRSSRPRSGSRRWPCRRSRSRSSGRASGDYIQRTAPPAESPSGARARAGRRGARNRSFRCTQGARYTGAPCSP